MLRTLTSVLKPFPGSINATNTIATLEPSWVLTLINLRAIPS